MNASLLTMPVSATERDTLLSLLAQFEELLEAPSGQAQPLLHRLTPPAYPDDYEASDEFSSATHDDLISRRLADLHAVRSSLADDEGSADIVVRLDPEATDSWLRTLTALRLVLATRLGIGGADDHSPEEPAFAVYDWLGYRLELLVQAADARDLEQHP